MAVVLLAALSWATTAEFTHHHGTAGFNQSLSNPTQAKQISIIPSVESTATKGTSSRSRTVAECLICQLHQNLSSTLFSDPPRVASAETKIRYAVTTALFRLSEFRSDQQGRAPPSNL